jgi:energy-coupling factor transporter ATP-binding protein EcfA2
MIKFPERTTGHGPNSLYIICSSSSTQSSYQMDALEHSVFSHYLIKALCGEVKNKNQESTADDVFDYLNEVVPWHIEQIKNQKNLSLSTQGATNCLEDIQQRPDKKTSGSGNPIIAVGVVSSFKLPIKALIGNSKNRLYSNLVNLLIFNKEVEVVSPAITSDNLITQIDNFFQGQGTRILYYRGELDAEIIEKIQANLSKEQNKKIKPILLIETIRDDEVNLNCWLEKLRAVSEHLENGIGFIGFNNREQTNDLFIGKLVAILEVAKDKNTGLTVAELMSNLGEDLAGFDSLKLWLSGERDILEIIPTPWQNNYISNIYERLNLSIWRSAAEKMIPDWLTTNPLGNMSKKFDINNIYVNLELASRSEIPKIDDDSHLDRPAEETNKYNSVDFCTSIIHEGKTPISKGKRIAIVGEPGSGKTTYLYKISEWLFDNTKSLPIWISLPDLQNKSLSDYLETIWLKEALKGTEVTEKMKEVMRKDVIPNSCLLLNGLDEACRANPKLTTDLDKDLNANFSSTPVVLSARLNFWDNNNKLWKFDSYKTLPFELEQIKDFIDKYFADSPEESERLKISIEEPENIYIRELVKNPLRLMMFCNTWRNYKGKLPKTQAALYETFCLEFYQFNNINNTEEVTQQTKNKINQALGKLALSALDDPDWGFRIYLEDIDPELNKEIGYHDQPDSPLGLALGIGWLNSVGVNEDCPRKHIYAFIHPTFQEYFAANSIDNWNYFLHHNSLKPNPSKNYLSQKPVYRIFDSKWRQTLIFWLGREEITLEDKQQFIETLLSFEDGCHEYNWYGARAALFAATAWQTLEKLSFTPTILEDLSQKIQSRLESFTNVTTYIIEAIDFYNINTQPAEQYLAELSKTNTDIGARATKILNSLDGQPQKQNILPVANEAAQELVSSHDLNDPTSRREFIKMLKNKADNLAAHLNDVIWLCVQKISYSDFYCAWNSDSVPPPNINIDYKKLFTQLQVPDNILLVPIRLALENLSSEHLITDKLYRRLANEIYAYIERETPAISDGIELQKELLNLLLKSNKEHLALIVYYQPPSPALIKFFKDLIDVHNKLCLAWIADEPLDPPLVSVAISENSGDVLQNWLRKI